MEYLQWFWGDGGWLECYLVGIIVGFLIAKIFERKK